MLKHVKTKILTVLLIFFLILLAFTLKTQANVSSTTFTSYFPSNSALAFQHENRFVTLNIISGTLNSSECTLKFDSGTGQYTFKANETLTLKIDYNVSNVQVSGDQNNNNRNIQSGDTITIDTGNNVYINWNILLEPLLPMMFIIGMVGLFAMIAGPLYGAKQLKKGEYYEGFRTSLVVTVVGFAFFIAWLAL